MRWRPTTLGRVGALSLAAAPILLASTTALAGNGLHPRTPVVWDMPEAPPCMTIIDRSDSATQQFDYTIPFEDIDVTPDEVDNSRTHQFTAFCRDRDPQTVLPNWLAWADVEAAGEKPLDVEPDEVDDEQVMDTSTDWEDCFVRITGDDARRPITYDSAEQGFDWDTTDVPAGTYVVYGYTYEPAFNLWVRRPGVVKVVDDPDPAASAPAGALTEPDDDVLYKNGSALLYGCASTGPGSTMSAYWSIADDSADWVPFIEDMPVESGDLEIDFTAPDELSGETAMFRLDVTDAEGRTYTSYMFTLVTVLTQDDPGECDPDGATFVADPGCEPGGSTGASDETAGDDTAEDTGGEEDTGAPMTTANADGGGDDDGGTCNCRAGRSLPPPSMLALGLLVLGLRRRRD